MRAASIEDLMQFDGVWMSFSFYVSISDFIYLYVILLIFNGDEKLNYIYISILDRFEYSLSIPAVNHFSNKKISVFFIPESNVVSNICSL